MPLISLPMLVRFARRLYQQVQLCRSTADGPAVPPQPLRPSRHPPFHKFRFRLFHLQRPTTGARLHGLLHISLLRLLRPARSPQRLRNGQECLACSFRVRIDHWHDCRSRILRLLRLFPWPASPASLWRLLCRIGDRVFVPSLSASWRHSWASTRRFSICCRAARSVTSSARTFAGNSSGDCAVCKVIWQERFPITISEARTGKIAHPAPGVDLGDPTASAAGLLSLGA